MLLATPSSIGHVVVPPGHGLETPLGRLGTVHKVPSALTHGQLAVVEHTLPPGVLAAPVHRHTREDELSIVVSGTLAAWIDGAVVTAETGAYVWKPRGQWHTFWNAGTTQLRFIELLMPGGFAQYFERLSQMFATGACPAPAALADLTREFGLGIDLEETATICARFALTLG